MPSIFSSVKRQFEEGVTDPLAIQEVVRKLHPHKIVGLGYVQNCLRTLHTLDAEAHRVVENHVQEQS